MLQLQKSPGLRQVLWLAGLFWLICNALVLHRYYSFYSSYANYNQGIFAQVLWNGLHGHWFESSMSSALSSAVVHDGQLPTVSYHRLGQHFTPSLVLWLPFYALYSSPAGLSCLQTTLIAAAGLVLYALARHYHPPHVSVLITASFYAAGAVVGPTLADFRDFSQLPLFVFGFLLSLEKRCWWAFWLLLGLTLMIREDAGIVLFSLGVYFICSRRYPWVGVAVCLSSLSYILWVTNVVMPMFSTDLSKRFMIEEFGQFVQDQDASTLEVIGAMLSQPGLMFTELFRPMGRTLEYLLAQWLPLAFIPALSPSAWLLTAFPMLKILLRQSNDALSIHLRYALTWVPGLFYGAILWWARYPYKFQLRIRKFWIFCMSLSLLVTALSNPNRALSFLIPDSFQPWLYVSPLQQWPHAQAIRSLLVQIPADASVSATAHIAGHLANRRSLLIFPRLTLRNDAGQVTPLDYAIADLWSLAQYQSVFDDDRAHLRTCITALNTMMAKPGDGLSYGLLDLQDGVLLLKRNALANPTAIAQWHIYQQHLETLLSQSQ